MLPCSLPRHMRTPHDRPDQFLKALGVEEAPGTQVPCPGQAFAFALELSAEIVRMPLLALASD